LIKLLNLVFWSIGQLLLKINQRCQYLRIFIINFYKWINQFLMLQVREVTLIILALPLLIRLVWLAVSLVSMSYWLAFIFFFQLPRSPSIAHSLHLIWHWPLNIICIFTLFLLSIWFLETLLLHQISESQFNTQFITRKSKVCD